MSDVIRTFAERGDLAHLALLLWALSASALTWFALRVLKVAEGPGESQATTAASNAEEEA